MNDFPRLIEHAFPLKQTSLDSVHEKNVRHGHISTLHIWPARRPLAACRAALIATLLPDPSARPKPAGMSDAQWAEEIKRRRRELCEKIAGKVVKKTERKKMPNGQTVERIKEETEGGILHWGRETSDPETLEWFRQEIRKAYGGRAPKVLDPFAGGGAIPLEAMRLGCEATAVDINPVAWFILKCALEYPQKLAGQTRPLPEFILHDDAFMAEFFKKAKGYGKADITAALKRLQQRPKKQAKTTHKGEQGGLPFAPAEGIEGDELQADLAWHVRAWGRWVLDRARRELAPYYPTYADFEPIKKDPVSYEHQPMRLVPLKNDGDAESAQDTGGGSKVMLNAWSQRRGKNMGYEAPAGKAVPLIDRIHRVMHLWKGGDVQKVDEYLDEHVLRRHELFKRVVQSLIELSESSERSLLESISNHIGAKGAVKDRGPMLFETASAAEDRE